MTHDFRQPDLTAALAQTLRDENLDTERLRREQAQQAQNDEHFQQRQDAYRQTSFLDVDQILTLDPPQPLIHGGILYQGTTAWLAGAPGSYKSFVALDWALSIASGTKWLQHPVEQGHVLYIVGEGLSGTSKRVGAWLDAKTITRDQVRGNITFVRRQDLTDIETQIRFAHEAITRNAKLIVIDTQARATPGINENNKDEMDPFIDYVAKLANDVGATILVVHHATKNGSDPLRGSGSIEGAADTVHVIEKQGELKAAITAKKHKDTESGTKIDIELFQHMESLVITNSAGEAEVGYHLSKEDRRRVKMRAIHAIVTSGKIGMTRAETVAEMLDEAQNHGLKFSRSACYRILTELADEGLTVTAKVGSSERIGATAKGKSWVRIEPDGTENEPETTPEG
jgi:hypothetical protein